MRFLGGENFLLGLEGGSSSQTVERRVLTLTTSRLPDVFKTFSFSSFFFLSLANFWRFSCRGVGVENSHFLKRTLLSLKTLRQIFVSDEWLKNRPFEVHLRTVFCLFYLLVVSFSGAFARNGVVSFL